MAGINWYISISPERAPMMSYAPQKLTQSVLRIELSGAVVYRSSSSYITQHCCTIVREQKLEPDCLGSDPSSATDCMSLHKFLAPLASAFSYVNWA